MTPLGLHHNKCYSIRAAKVTVAQFRITALSSAPLRATSLRIATLRASPQRSVPVPH